MTHQIVPVKVYATVFGALLILTVTTVAVSKLELGELNLVAALAIAVVKGSLVAWFFMDLRRSASLTKLVAAGGLLWLAILLAFVVSDYASRNWLPKPGWLH